jgi:hypothetical protein
MISAWWLLAMFVAGFFLGFFICAMLVAASGALPDDGEL